MFFRADYDNDTESEYFDADNDASALEIANEKTGTECADIGFVKCELVQLAEVDEKSECFGEIRIVYY